jgi:hypothetical protein
LYSVKEFVISLHYPKQINGSGAMDTIYTTWEIIIILMLLAFVGGLILGVRLVREA